MFSYDAGSSTVPTYAGLAEFGSVRFNDGTFKSHVIPPLVSSPPVRDAVSQLPSTDGGYAGTAYLDPWEFDLEAWLWVPTGPDDVPAAVDYLKQYVNLTAGLVVMPVRAKGWSANRQITVRVTGPIVVNEPDITLKKVPRRDFTVPLVAPDPRIYSVTEHSQTITTATGVTNAGNVSTPFKVRFNGPQTNPKIDVAGTSGTARIRVAATITSGHYIEVNTYSNGVTIATDDSGNNAYGVGTYGNGVSAATLKVLPPGATSLTATNDSGAGSTVLYWRDAY